MKTCVIRLRHHLQVLRIVVRLVAVNMMNDLATTQATTDRLLCNQAMLGDVAFRVCARMIRCLHEHVTTAHRPAAIPADTLTPLGNVLARAGAEAVIPGRFICSEWAAAHFAGVVTAALASCVSTFKRAESLLRQSWNDLEWLRAAFADDLYARGILAGHRSQSLRCLPRVGATTPGLPRVQNPCPQANYTTSAVSI